MEGEITRQKEDTQRRGSDLLEFAACDDLEAFKREIEEKGVDVDETGFWYCRKVGTKKMGFQVMTPLMVAAMYGGIRVLKYIISTGKSDVNRICGEEKITAYHCAVAGCAWSVVEVINILLDASSASNSVDANGNKPIDLISRISRSVTVSKRKAMEFLLKGGGNLMDYELNHAKEGQDHNNPVVAAAYTTKYPGDASLPDINEGVYGTDEFRMFSFKVKPCSRAYSHDWTECPFVHPGENARRRDPRKYPYTCVPCPEFRKGSMCPKGDACEYAHGIFESWLHPAQYRTRLCKDETGCPRKVCFFAHKHEELRPVNVSTGSAVVSPRSNISQPPVGGMDVPAMSPLTLGSPALSYSPSVSSPPITPSPRNGGLWPNHVNNLNLNITPPTLQLQNCRLKSALSARDSDAEMEMRIFGLNNSNGQMGFGSFESSSSSSSMPSPLQSPGRFAQSCYYPTSPARNLQQPSSGFAAMNSRSAAFAKRSLSFKPTAAAAASNLSDWGSPNGNLDWGIHGGDEMNKLRRSVSFGIRGNNYPVGSVHAARDYSDEPDVSWVNSLVKESAGEGTFGMNEKVREKLRASWTEQMYIGA